MFYSMNVGFQSIRDFFVNKTLVISTHLQNRIYNIYVRGLTSYNIKLKVNTQKFHLSCITCHVSHFICHMSHVTCRMSPVNNDYTYSRRPPLLIPTFFFKWSKPSKNVRSSVLRFKLKALGTEISSPNGSWSHWRVQTTNRRSQFCLILNLCFLYCCYVCRGALVGVTTIGKQLCCKTREKEHRNSERNIYI